MANAETDLPTTKMPPKSSLKGLILSVWVAAALGGGAFYAAWSGLVLGQTKHGDSTSAAVVQGLPDIAFVPVPPIVVSLGPGSKSRHLRFHAQLEVDKMHADDVTKLLPRIVDVLNGFLRAVEPSELEEPGALIRLRAQMLRRIQIVTGEGRIRDLLIMEFILN